MTILNLLARSDPPSPLRILLSEGASTSAREAITALGLRGHYVEIVDPNRHCLGRFSRFVRRVHRCPPLGSDPAGYRDFVLGLLANRRFDVLVPIHEQGYLLAKIAHLLEPLVSIALPAFESYERAISRIGFRALLSELDIPQPPSIVATSMAELRAIRDFPFVVKSEIGTASRAVWMVWNDADLVCAIDAIGAAGAFGRGVLVQELVDGPIEHAQGIFCRGRLIAMHAYRQLERGAGGGDALKESVDRPDVRDHLARIGAALAWHGALSVDYIQRPADGMPLYIDCNPRLVEPMSGLLAGIDLMDVLLRVSVRDNVSEQPSGSSGVRSRLALQALMGAGLRGATRREVLRTVWHATRARGGYIDSQEELTPVRTDWQSLLPLMATGAALMISPGYAHALAARGWGEQLLRLETMEEIRSWSVPA